MQKYIMFFLFFLNTPIFTMHSEVSLKLYKEPKIVKKASKEKMLVVTKRGNNVSVCCKKKTRNWQESILDAGMQLIIGKDIIFTHTFDSKVLKAKQYNGFLYVLLKNNLFYIFYLKSGKNILHYKFDSRVTRIIAYKKSLHVRLANNHFYLFYMIYNRLEIFDYVFESRIIQSKYINNRFLCVALENNQLYVCDMATNISNFEKPKAVFCQFDDKISKIIYILEGRFICVGLENNTIAVCDIATESSDASVQEIDIACRCPFSTPAYWFGYHTGVLFLCSKKGELWICDLRDNPIASKVLISYNDYFHNVSDYNYEIRFFKYDGIYLHIQVGCKLLLLTVYREENDVKLQNFFSCKYIGGKCKASLCNTWKNGFLYVTRSNGWLQIYDLKKERRRHGSLPVALIKDSKFKHIKFQYARYYDEKKHLHLGLENNKFYILDISAEKSIWPLPCNKINKYMFAHTFNSRVCASEEVNDRYICVGLENKQCYVFDRGCDGLEDKLHRLTFDKELYIIKTCDEYFICSDPDNSYIIYFQDELQQKFVPESGLQADYCKRWCHKKRVDIDKRILAKKDLKERVKYLFQEYQDDSTTLCKWMILNNLNLNKRNKKVLKAILLE